MDLTELKRHVDFLLQNGNEGKEIVITTKDPHVGGRHGVSVSSINMGMDFEHGQIRIEPTEDLVRNAYARDDIMRPRIHAYTYSKGRKRILLLCPKCENHLRKDDCFCSRCGQKVKGIAN